MKKACKEALHSLELEKKKASLSREIGRMGEPKSEVNQELESTDSTKFMKLRKRFY